MCNYFDWSLHEPLHVHPVCGRGACIDLFATFLNDSITFIKTVCVYLNVVSWQVCVLLI